LEGVEPLSTCELEVDAVAADILNRLDIEGMRMIIPDMHCYSQNVMRKQSRGVTREVRYGRRRQGLPAGYIPWTEV
jgi:DNA polymerase zeta